MKNSAPFPPKPDFSITILSQTQLLKMVVELTRHIATLFQFPVTEAQKISLAIDEAVTNVIKHSYANEVGHEIRIEYFLADAGMRILIVYRGLPPDIDVYDAAAWSAPGPLSDISVAWGSMALPFPDFTRGAWQTPTPVRASLESV